jgi:hypothetical protein
MQLESKIAAQTIFPLFMFHLLLESASPTYHYLIEHSGYIRRFTASAAS